MCVPCSFPYVENSNQELNLIPYARAERCNVAAKALPYRILQGRETFIWPHNHYRCGVPTPGKAWSQGLDLAALSGSEGVR